MKAERGVVVLAVIAAAIVGCNDVPIDDALDAAAIDSATADGAIEAAAEVAVDAGADTELDVADSADTTSVVTDAPADGEAGCVSGSLCTDLTICKAGTCTPCTTDSECTAIHSWRGCYGGFCQIGNCKPTGTPSGCTEMGATCCATETSAGTCFSRMGETNCCDDTACAALPKLTKCNLTLHACGCPAPTAGELHVSPTGVDSNPLRGNGSAACPYKTITEAVFAANGATTPITIVLDAATTGPTTYGLDCTGGSPCDSTPIGISTAIVKGMKIKGGTGKAADIVVAGDGASVFDVRAAGVGFADLTVKPTRYAVNGAGGHAIVYAAPAGTTDAPESTITNVALRGVYATSVVAGAGTGIVFSGGASPTMSGGITIDGFFLGINVTGPARPALLATATTPATISNIGDNCVRAHSTTATVTGFDIRSTDGTKSIAIRDCGSRAVSLDNTATATDPSRLEGVVIRKTSTGGSFDGVSVRTAGVLNVADVDVFNVTGRGVIVDVGSSGTRPVLSLKRTTIDAAGGVGALFQGYGDVDIDGLTITTSTSIGVQLAGFTRVTGRTVSVTDAANVGVSVSGNATMTLTGLTVKNGTTTGLNVLGSAVATLTNTDVRDTIGVGVVIQGLGKATMSGLIVRAAKSHGVRVLETGELDLTGADVRDSVTDGLRCEGTGILKLRKSAFVLNKANGVFITGSCVADLGTTTDLGENVFNKASLKNTTSGLCFNATTTQPTPSTSTFGCGATMAPCTTPTTLPSASLLVSATCGANRDVTAATTMLTIPTPKCCFD